MSSTTTNTIIAAYQKLKQEYTDQSQQLSRKHFRLGILRLLSILIALTGFYYYYTLSALWVLGVALPAIVLFFFLRKIQQETGRKKAMAQYLVQVNEEEITYLQNGTLSSTDGSEFQDLSHAYAADLDLFGPRSLYQHLNRTATQMGKSKLATALKQLVSSEEIRNRQKAIAESGMKLTERQYFYAAGKIARDNTGNYEALIKWSETKEKPLSKAIILLAYVMPAALIAMLALYLITGESVYASVAKRIVPLNILFFSFLLKRIKTSVAGIEKVQATLHAYSTLLVQIEQTGYDSSALISLKKQLQSEQISASQQIRKLSKIFSGMETMQNPFAALAMNGLYLYHIHNLQKLILWKNRYAGMIPTWLTVIGEFEMLHSLANFHYNNPGYCFPVLNHTYGISFVSTGHPLIHESKRVCNDINFNEHPFVILTGSNMSGKSTFLRTLGINMVLAGMGSVVCARSASIHPLPVFVSMRQTDSLADSESYFFAEVKRLKYIIDGLQQEPSFVLLDEILRGTNSDDKRSGTIGVIEKIIRTKAIGAIATHDLEVCHTTDKYPGILSNQCFEVAIVENELVFDYTLRQGICQNKSATFLMKKMDII
ncbi:MAG: hypothetical protein WC716_13050 [Chitinophagaceae bacterium]|jgi:hypothetical protein